MGTDISVYLYVYINGKWIEIFCDDYNDPIYLELFITERNYAYFSILNGVRGKYIPLKKHSYEIPV